MFAPENTPLYDLEFGNTYDLTIGDTVVTITSKCQEDAKEDILEALVRLMKRDIAGIEAG